MAKITLQGNEINTIGNLPAVGETAGEFVLTSPFSSDDRTSHVK